MSKPRGFAKIGIILSLIVFLNNASHLAMAQAPRVYRDHITPHWFGGDSRFWYVNDLAQGGREFILVNAETATRQPAFDHARAAKALATFLKKNVEPNHLPVDSIRFSDDGKSVVLFGPQNIWRLNLDEYAIAEAADESRPPPKPAGNLFGRGAGRRGGGARRPATESRTAIPSPDGK